ncbi:MAG TPA: segregation/condensation protein A [bacterium]|nr:MAG: Segregation and condensation protein A [Parcubacteria group bacterium ADurb.Bin192]HPN14728.1 segregation/condensation protein A [bacterium]
MAYTVQIEHFEGPLDLLLQLVERDELAISKISLAKVADQFVHHMQSDHVPAEEMADFLLVASKLVYIKSQLLLPDFKDEQMEEGPDLEAQLRQYQMFVNASRELDAAWKTGAKSFERGTVITRQREIKFVPPVNANLEVMREMMKKVIARLEPIIKMPKAAIKRAVSIHERIDDLFKRIKTHAKMSFRHFLKDATHKEDAIVSFLALLELIKQRFVVVNQGDLFHDIDIKISPDAPERDPLAESFV